MIFERRVVYTSGKAMKVQIPEGEQKERKSFHSPSGARATCVRDSRIEFHACSVFLRPSCRFLSKRESACSLARYICVKIFSKGLIPKDARYEHVLCIS